MIIHPFRALRAAPQSAQEVASVPYDVVSTAEARQFAEGKPLSFLHVVRSEIDLPADADPYSPEVYNGAAKSLASLREQGHLVEEPQPCLFAYRMTMGDHSQLGLFACCSVDEYEQGTIKKHELTRKAKEDDRTNHIMATQAQSGPVLLTIKDDARVDELLAGASEKAPTLSATSETGVRHDLWKIERPEQLVDAFAKIPVSYIADGHHRSASAARACQRSRSENTNHAGNEEYNFFLAAIFPAPQMKIMAYNRVVKDLAGLSGEEVLERAAERFDITDAASPEPSGPEKFCVYVDGKWHHLAIRAQFVSVGDPVRALDCSLLQEHFIKPILGIKELRTDPRIDFVGGIRGTDELERRVDDGGAAIAFSLYPVTVPQLMAVADANEIMPPKSTWFEPKLRSGLVVHVI